MSNIKNDIVSNIDATFGKALHNFSRIERLEYKVFVPINQKYIYAQKDENAFLIDIESKEKSDFFILSVDDLKTGKYFDEDFIHRGGNSKLHLVSKDLIFGFIDKKGKLYLMKQYAMVSDFSEKYAAVMTTDDLWGYVNEKLEEVIPCKYEGVGFFQGGYATFIKAGKIGFINKQGEEIISPKYDFAKPFKNGVAKVKKDNHWKCIDSRETELSTDEYDETGEEKIISPLDCKDLYWSLNITDQNILVTTHYEYNLNLTDKKVISLWESC